MAIPISEFFRVTTRIAVGGVVTQNFGRGLVLTTDDALSAGGTGKSRYFSVAEDVSDFFGADSAPSKAAQRWFGYSPYPQGLYVGRWANVAVDTIMEGSTTHGTITQLAVNNATFRLAGEDAQVNLSADSTLADVAAGLQANIRGEAYTGAVAQAVASGTIRVADFGDVGITQATAATGAADDETITFVAPRAGGTRAVAVVVDESAGAIVSITFDPTVKSAASPGSGYGVGDGDTIAVDPSETTDFTRAPVMTVPLGRRPLTPALDGAEVRYEGGQFVIELAGPNEIDPPYMETHSAGSGTDISSLLGLSQTSAPTYKVGSNAEGPGDAVGAVTENLSDRPTYVFIDDEVPGSYGVDSETVPALWAYAEANDYIFGFSDISDEARTAGETGSLLARANNAQLGNTLPCVADDERRSHVGALAALSSINWDQPASIITLFGKTLPGTPATEIDETQLQAIRGKRGNVYTRVGGLPTFIEGTMARAGYWADSVAFTLWMKNELELNIWNAARASRRLTVAILQSTLDAVMRKGVRNGGIQPGRNVSNVTAADIRQVTGNHDFDGVLPSGYLIHIGRLADQTDADRENRLAPPVKIWAVGSEAIHQANVDLVFVG